MRIYVAGPMSGIPADNAPAFEQAAEKLRSMGHDVVTPIELNAQVWKRHNRIGEYDPSLHRVEYGDPILDEMYAVDLHEVCTRDAIALLPGFEKSRGGGGEVYVATLLGKRVLDAETGLDIAVGVHLVLQRFTPPIATGQLHLGW